MKNISSWIVNHPKTIIVTYLIIVITSLILTQFVGTNYNLIDYLPDEMDSKQAINVLEDEFGLQGSANVLLEPCSIEDILRIKSEIQKVNNVDTVIWLDDVVDIHQPIDFIDQSIVEAFYKDGYSYLQVMFVEDDYSSTTTVALSDINEIIDGKGGLSGPAVTSSGLTTGLSGNMSKIVGILLPIILLILILSTGSFFEVILFLITIGVAILINNGTNILFGKISFISASSSALLQLAIAMDYSIFLLHRFAEEHKGTNNAKEAMNRSILASISTISSSAITTIVGFLALTLMTFTIGKDLGLVLAKGILISMLCVTTLLPALAIVFDKLIQKTSHRDFIPSFRKLAILFEKGRFIIVALIVLISIPAFLAQSEVNLIFSSESSQAAPEVVETDQKIKELFGGKNSVLVLVPNEDPFKEYAMMKELSDIDSVNQVQGIYSIIDPSIPLEFLPSDTASNFVSENYSRYVLNLDTAVESEAAFIALDEIKLTLSKYYEEYYTTGQTVSTADTKAVSEKDIMIISTVSIVAVGIVLVFTFKSLITPLLMLLIIQIAIWINMAIPYFTGSDLNYIGFLIVSALQLGATIDYAILLSNRYIENRNTMPKEEASIEAVTKSSHSIFTSSSILGASGISMYLFFSEATLRSMGLLIGRGALISGFAVIIVLPQILLLMDKFIIRTPKSLVKPVPQIDEI